MCNNTLIKQALVLEQQTGISISWYLGNFWYVFNLDVDIYNVFGQWEGTHRRRSVTVKEANRYLEYLRLLDLVTHRQ